MKTVYEGWNAERTLIRVKLISCSRSFPGSNKLTQNSIVVLAVPSSESRMRITSGPKEKRLAPEQHLTGRRFASMLRAMDIKKHSRKRPRQVRNVSVSSSKLGGASSKKEEKDSLSYKLCAMLMRFVG